MQTENDESVAQINGDEITAVGQYPENSNFYVTGTATVNDPDGKHYVVPNDSRNPSYQAVQDWLAESGNAITPLTIPE